MSESRKIEHYILFSKLVFIADEINSQVHISSMLILIGVTTVGVVIIYASFTLIKVKHSLFEA